MATYKKIDNDTFETLPPSFIPEVIKLSELIMKKADKIKEKDGFKKTEPKNAELVEYGKMYYPYYATIEMIEQEEIRLQMLIDELNSIV